MLMKNLVDKKPDFIHGELAEYWDEYKIRINAEISSLEKITFGKTSLFDFCNIDDINKLADLSCNEQIQDMIINENLIKKYLFFGSKIKENFERGLKRNRALKTALNSVYYNNKNEQLLPPECWKQVLKNLDVQVLKNITKVATLFFRSTSFDIDNNKTKTTESNKFYLKA